MNVQKLFHVLVVMCGTSAAACDSEDDDSRERRDNPAPDASTDESNTSTADAATPPVEGAPCFCDTQTCCDRSSEPAEVADGFVCCWSTTCP